METFTARPLPETPEERKQDLIAKFMWEAVLFAKINARVKRDSINPETDRFGLNQDANREKRASLKWIDNLLDEYNGEQLPVEETTGTVWETEPIDARSSE